MTNHAHNENASIETKAPADTVAPAAAGMQLTDWIVARIDGQKRKAMIQYTIRPTVMTVDTRAAADACNRELASAGDTFDRRAVEQKLAECAPGLREWLSIDAEEIEVEE